MSKSIGQIIKNRREELGISQAELARRQVHCSRHRSRYRLLACISRKRQRNMASLRRHKPDAGRLGTARGNCISCTERQTYRLHDDSHDIHDNHDYLGHGRELLQLPGSRQHSPGCNRRADHFT